MKNPTECDVCNVVFDLGDGKLPSDGDTECETCYRKREAAAYADYRAHNPAEGEIDPAGAYEKNDPKHPTYLERAFGLADIARKEAKGE